MASLMKIFILIDMEVYLLNGKDPRMLLWGYEKNGMIHNLEKTLNYYPLEPVNGLRLIRKQRNELLLSGYRFTIPNV
jgi:hypothetical protein